MKILFVYLDISSENKYPGYYSRGVGSLISIARGCGVLFDGLIAARVPSILTGGLNGRGPWRRLRALKRQGITLLMTTHYMDEAESLCDEIVIMNAGKVIEKGAPKDLVRRHIGRFTLEVPVNGGDVEGTIRASFEDSACRVERVGDRVYVYADRSEALTGGMQAVAAYDPILRPSTLEDVFLKLTGRELSQGA